MERAALYDVEDPEPPTPTPDLAFLVGATLGGARARGERGGGRAGGGGGGAAAARARGGGGGGGGGGSRGGTRYARLVAARG